MKKEREKERTKKESNKERKRKRPKERKKGKDRKKDKDKKKERKKRHEILVLFLSPLKYDYSNRLMMVFTQHTLASSFSAAQPRIERAAGERTESSLFSSCAAMAAWPPVTL